MFYVFGQYDFGVRILTYYDHPGFENIKILNQDVSKGFLLFQNSTGMSLSINVWHHMCTAIDIKNAKMWNVWVSLPPEEENELKYPIHMDYLVLFESSCYCKASSQVPPTMDSTSALEL